MKYLTLVILGLCTIGCATPKGASLAEQRRYVDQVEQDTFKELYERDPAFKEKIERSVGHGVFSNIGTNLIFVTTEGGFGVVVDKQTGQKTYMRMAGGGVGIGLGAKDVRLVFIFRSKSDVAAFVSGQWAVGADADAAAKAGDQGGELSGTAKTGGAEIYTLTKNGIALSATVGGTRFYRDDALNTAPTGTASAD